MLVFERSHYVAQVALEWLGSSDPPVSASLVTGTTGQVPPFSVVVFNVLCTSSSKNQGSGLCSLNGEETEERFKEETK